MVLTYQCSSVNVATHRQHGRHDHEQDGRERALLPISAFLAQFRGLVGDKHASVDDNCHLEVGLQCTSQICMYACVLTSLFACILYKVNNLH